MTIDEYFDGRVFLINCRHREDRLAQATAELARLGITRWERFEAHTGIVVNGRVNSNAGCTSSHRAIHELIAANRWRVSLILEDDCSCIYADWEERFDRFIAEVPSDFGLLYFGGGYAEPPIRRVSKHVIQVAGMMTTSSYAITWQQAAKMAPHLTGIGPVDSIFQHFNRDAPSYCMSPRAIVQRPSYSDLQEREMSNAQSMLDRALEAGIA